MVRLLAENRWPFRLHATYEETITRALTRLRKGQPRDPFDGLHWFFDHCETISDRNIERVKALGGGIAVQDRMAFRASIRRSLRRESGPAHATHPADARNGRAGRRGHGCDPRRQLQPFRFAVLDDHRERPVGGLGLMRKTALLSRGGSPSPIPRAAPGCLGKKGNAARFSPGQLADLAVLTDDYFSRFPMRK